jgi:hypothetical protein
VWDYHDWRRILGKPRSLRVVQQVQYSHFTAFYVATQYYIGIRSNSKLQALQLPRGRHQHSLS